MKYASAALLVVLLGLSGRLIDFPKLSGGFKGDEQTYVLMATSMASDFDVKYQRQDLLRFKALTTNAEHPNGVGPDGIFIKKGSRIVSTQWHWPLHLSPPHITAPIELTKQEVPTTQSIEYGKGIVYPLFAAPFVWLGGLGGMFMFNVVLLGACAWLGAKFAKARTKSAAGFIFGILFVFASVIPVWTAWLTPELFNFALVFFAYFLWLYKEVRQTTLQHEWWRRAASDYVAAALIGIATASKPTHALMIAPLGLLALWRRQLGRAIVMGIAFVSVVAVFNVATLISTGEMNFQGSDYIDGRISCYGAFPFDDRGTPFAVSPQCGSKVTNESNDERIVTMGVIPVPELRWTYARNAYYFTFGRHSGLLPYFFPGALIAVLMLLRFWEAKPWQWLTLSAVAGEALVQLALIPWTWNGAGGPPGNRYFMSIYPAMLFLLPASARWGSTLVSALGGFVFTGAMTLHPFVAAKQTWLAPRRQPLAWLPIEKTIINDLPVRLQEDRSRIQWRHQAYVQFYFFDENVYSMEETGVWMRGDSTADIVVKAAEPLTRISFDVRSDIDNTFTLKMGSTTWTTDLKAGEHKTFELAPGFGVWSKEGTVYQMTWSCTKGFVPSERDPSSKDTRVLGVFVEPTFYDASTPIK